MEVMVVVDRARRDALDVGLLHDGGERLLGQAPRLEQAGEVGALAQLRNAQLDGAGPRLPEAITIAVALREPLGALLAVAGPGQAGTSSSISRSAAKPIISRKRSPNETDSSLT
jgi:hypothetical protein